MSFDVSAEAYDRFMGVHSRQLSPQLADLAELGPATRVLDVGCGPGALTAELVERVGAGSVSALDPSESFVAAVRARYPEVDARRAAVEAIPYRDDDFDAALAQLVVHFMADPEAGLREMARVTRPGGVVAASVWDLAGDRAPLSPFWRAFRELRPGVNDESGLPGVREGQLVELFERAGLERVEGSVQVARVEYETFEQWWEPFTFGVGPAGAALRALDDGGREELRERARRLLPEAPFVLESSAWAARGLV
jgi:SAM-dependent methyltransferase